MTLPEALAKLTWKDIERHPEYKKPLGSAEGIGNYYTPAMESIHKLNFAYKVHIEKRTYTSYAGGILCIAIGLGLGAFLIAQGIQTHHITECTLTAFAVMAMCGIIGGAFIKAAKDSREGLEADRKLVVNDLAKCEMLKKLLLEHEQQRLQHEKEKKEQDPLNL